MVEPFKLGLLVVLGGLSLVAAGVGLAGMLRPDRPRSVRSCPGCWDDSDA